MNPGIGKRSSITKEKEKQQPKTKTAVFIEANTHKVIGIREHFVYLDDVKLAININALEQRMITKQWLLRMLDKFRDIEKLKRHISESAELDRHRIFKL